MALYKEVITQNGVPVSYHRIALLTIEVNGQNTILVHSYVGEDGRQMEKDHAAGVKEMTDDTRPYVYAEYRNCDYDESMNIPLAYEWLKRQPDFEDASDC